MGKATHIQRRIVLVLKREETHKWSWGRTCIALAWIGTITWSRWKSSNRWSCYIPKYWVLAVRSSIAPTNFEKFKCPSFRILKIQCSPLVWPTQLFLWWSATGTKQDENKREFLIELVGDLLSSKHSHSLGCWFQSAQVCWREEYGFS